MRTILFIQVAITLMTSMPGHGAVIQDTTVQVASSALTGDSPAQEPREERRLPPNPNLGKPGSQVGDLTESDSSLVEARMFPLPVQSGNEVTTSVRRISASFDVSEVVGNRTRKISVDGVKMGDGDDEKPFIAANFDDVDDGADVRLSAKATTASTTTVTTSSTTTTSRTSTSTTTPTATSYLPPQSSNANFVIKQVKRPPYPSFAHSDSLKLVILRSCESPSYVIMLSS